MTRTRTCRRRWPTGWVVDGGSADELFAVGRTVAHFGDIEVLIVRTRRGVFAVENRCPHAARRLTDASVSGRNVVCAGHGLRVDLPSGRIEGRVSVSTRRLRTFGVAIADGRVWLSLKDHM